MTGGELQAGVIDLARLFGWRVAHFRPARTAKGWRTPVAADGKGWPDLTLVRGDRLLFVEVKGSGDRLRPEQRVWLEALESTAAEVYIWHPPDWPDRVRAILEPQRR